MYRRSLLGTAIAVPGVWAGGRARAQGAAPAAQPQGSLFGPTTVRDIAQDLASRPFVAQDTALPDFLAHLSYDQYRTLRFDKNQALWRNTPLPWQVELFHRGFIYAGRVDINEVAGGRSVPVPYRPDLFGFGPGIRRPTNEDLGFAGFRLHAPLNRPDYFDEVCAFLGASYFRAVSKGLQYGLSARGLALRTADNGGEEFPFFRKFWIERPDPAIKPGSLEPITLHALLDSPSVTAAFRFVIKPGEDTVFDTQVTLIPRVDLDQVGVAPLTSMFLFDSNDRHRVDDWRPAVHDSDGLWIATGRGEELWRALANPARLQVSVFADNAPRAFGLLQRKRQLTDYQDLESHYDRRPSAWVEPVGDWGPGRVILVEIPTDKEINDNVVAFWRPQDKLQAKVPYSFAYRLHWSGLPAARKDAPAPVVRTMVGGGLTDTGTRVFVLDFAPLPEAPALRADVTSDKGELRHVVSQPTPEGGWRISFELAPGREQLIELHARLVDAAEMPVSQTWLYRWTSA